MLKMDPIQFWLFLKMFGLFCFRDSSSCYCWRWNHPCCCSWAFGPLTQKLGSEGFSLYNFGPKLTSVQVWYCFVCKRNSTIVGKFDKVNYLAPKTNFYANNETSTWWTRLNTCHMWQDIFQYSADILTYWNHFTHLKAFYLINKVRLTVKSLN